METMKKVCDNTRTCEAAVPVGRIRTLAELGPGTWAKMRTSAPWIARQACVKLEKGTLEGDPKRWPVMLALETGGRKIRGKWEEVNEDELEAQLARWPMREVGPPLSACIITVGKGELLRSEYEWASALCVEHRTRIGSVQAWRNALRTDIHGSANQGAYEERLANRLEELVRKHLESEIRAELGSQANHEGGALLRRYTAKGETQFVRHWRRNPILGKEVAKRIPIRCVEGSERKWNPHLGWYLDYGDAQQFLAATAKSPAPWEIERHEGAYLEINDIEKASICGYAKRKGNENEGKAAGEAVGRILKRLRADWATEARLAR